MNDVFIHMMRVIESKTIIGTVIHARGLIKSDIVLIKSFKQKLPTRHLPIYNAMFINDTILMNVVRVSNIIPMLTYPNDDRLNCPDFIMITDKETLSKQQTNQICEAMLDYMTNHTKASESIRQFLIPNKKLKRKKNLKLTSEQR